MVLLCVIFADISYRRVLTSYCHGNLYNPIQIQTPFHASMQVLMLSRPSTIIDDLISISAEMNSKFHYSNTVWRETLVVGKFGKLSAKPPLAK